MPRAFSRPSAWPACQARIKGRHRAGDHSPGAQAGAGARGLMAAKRSRSCAAPSGHLPEPSCDSLLILPNVSPLSVSTLAHAAPHQQGGYCRGQSPRHVHAPNCKDGICPARSSGEAHPRGRGTRHILSDQGGPLSPSPTSPWSWSPNTNAAIHKNVHNCCWTAKSSLHDQTHGHVLATGKHCLSPSSHPGPTRWSAPCLITHSPINLIITSGNAGSAPSLIAEPQATVLLLPGLHNPRGLST